jgi:hypothetical protein
MKVKALTTDGGMVIGNEYEVSENIYEILQSVNRVCKPEEFEKQISLKNEMSKVKEVKSESDGLLDKPLTKKGKK